MTCHKLCWFCIGSMILGLPDIQSVPTCCLATRCCVGLSPLLPASACRQVAETLPPQILEKIKPVRVCEGDRGMRIGAGRWGR